MNKGIFTSLLLSILIHGLIAAGMALYMSYAPVSDELAQLDLTSVDLSFAETPCETAAVVPASAPRTQTAPLPPPRPQKEPPPLSDPTGLSIPRNPPPDTADLPNPDELVEQVETPLRPQPTPTRQQPTVSPAPVAPRQARIDATPKPRRNIKPDYPKESRQRGEQGHVTLEISVDDRGRVDDVRVLRSSGFPLLDEAAVKAARSARFTPARSGGKPIASTARLTLEFKLK